MVRRFERFSLAIAQIDRCWHKIAADEMAKYGLKGPYAVYLITMCRYSEGVTARQLAEECGKDKADVSRAIAAMEKQGLVRRTGVSQSLYRARLQLTDEGRAAAEQVHKRAAVAVEVGGEGISEEHREIFYQTLELIAANLQAISEEGLPKP